MSSAGTSSGCRRTYGFTLVELMIVVAIVAILSAIAYPSYQGHVVRTRRAAAAVCALEVAQFMERYYTTHLRYVDDDGAAPSLPALQCRTDLAAHYDIGLAGATTASSYSVVARPRGGQQTRDSKCGALTLDEKGSKGAAGASTDATGCW